MVYIKTYKAPEVDKNEIRRYCGIPFSADNVSEATDKLIDECIAEISGKLVYKVCYEEYNISVSDADDKVIDLGFAKTESKALKKHLSGCERIIVFAATVGIEIDRLIARYGILSPGRAAVLQAIGAERVEALCDAFCEDTERNMKEKGCGLTRRFSAGYGDLPLSLQKDIFNRLDCHRKIGLTLNDSMLMSPSKSVTAVMGVTSEPIKQENKLCGKCNACENTECSFRQEG